ncbi:MAG: O-unit flippase-like protein [Bacteroidales bacterium]|nr:O-unit flippase-like protein [Bacteroidales bacterium]
MAVADIGKKDLVWTILATFFKLGAGVLLFPFILNKLPAQTIGIWTIFTSVGVISTLLDFGFNQSFARNVAYVFSGVKNLQKQGYQTLNEDNIPDELIDYNLLKSTIRAMRFFYSRVALFLFLFLISVGTLYIHSILNDYTGNQSEIYVSWIIVCLNQSYSLYTLYFESLLYGRGLVKRSNQFVLLGYLMYVTVAVVFLMLGYGLIAIVSAQFISNIIIRLGASISFFTKGIKEKLKYADDSNYKDVLTAISPNAVKVGLSALGSFVINKSSTFLGPYFVSLADMGAYGVTLQLINVVASVSQVFTNVYIPKVFQWRVEKKMEKIKHIFYTSSLILFVVFLGSYVVVLFFGNWTLNLMHSNTQLISNGLLSLLFIHTYLSTNHANAAQYLLSKNEVPFFKASLWSAFFTLILFIIFEVFLDLKLVGMILAPTIAQLVYQNWKWPLEVIKDFYKEK